MGSTVHLLGFGGPASAGQEAIEQIEALERAWSRFRDDGELSVLNDDPDGVVAVSDELAGALRRALLAWRLTDGWFDPTVHDALVAAGYDRTFRSLPDVARPVPAGVRVPGCDGVSIDHVGRVHRPPGLRFDLGGIGKGLAADLVAEELVGRGVRSVSIAVGGDVRVAGVAPEGGWSVPVLDPFADDDRMMNVEMDTGAIVTSTTRVRRWQTEDGGWAHHLIDPVTGRPADNGVAAVVAIAAEAWWAEVVAKAALVAGADRGRALMARHGVQGWMVLDDTSVLGIDAAGGPSDRLVRSGGR
jgi:thiamine biosynthesis lipoprotein